MRRTTAIAVAEATMVAETRRRAASLAESLSFDHTQGGRVAIVATELATNLIKHAGGGSIYASRAEVAGGTAVDLLAVDTGPGMHDVETCLRDGFSTAGSPGTGLGAIARLSSSIDIYSQPGVGTVVHARIYGSGGPSRETFDIHGISLPHPGEEAVGDGWSYEISDRTCRVFLTDGLGHGPLAATAAAEGIAAFHGAGAVGPMRALEEVHVLIRGTRGSVAGLALIDLAASQLVFSGIGNIGAMIVEAEQTKRLVSHNGTLGSNVRRFQELTYPFPRGAVLVLTSDGIATQVDLGKYPGLAARSSALIAGIVIRDFNRERDDTTVVVVREATEHA
jgi:anti-sigma regulatory factor (Ser/Thr protein kinase)